MPAALRMAVDGKPVNSWRQYEAYDAFDDSDGSVRITRGNDPGASGRQKSRIQRAPGRATVPGRDGTPRKVSATFKVADAKLSGTVSGRNGDTAIDDPKLSGDDLSFSVTREINGNKFVQKFSGKVSGDSIKGKIAFDRNGEPQTVDWNATRDAAKPAEPAAKSTEPAPKPAQP